MPNAELGIEASLDLSNWSRGVQTLLRDDPKISSAMESIVDSIDEVTSSLEDIGGDMDVAVTVEADTADLDTLTESLDTLETDDHTAEVTTDADPSALQPYYDKLGTIAAAAGAAVLAVAALGGAALTAALGAGVRALNDYDGALDSITIHTGRAIPGARELIEDIYNDGFDASKQQIADVIALTAQLGIATDKTGTATREAFITAANTGQDVQDTLRAMNRLVESGLAANFEDAGDLLTVGLQNGANLGGDMNTTLQNSASVLHDMGFTGQEALALISNGLQAGYNSAGDVVNQLLIVRQRLSESNAEVDGALRALGQTDEADAYLQGAISGGEFMAGLSDALAEVDDPARRLDLQNSIFGGRQGRNLSQDMLDSLGEVGVAFDDIAGRSHAAYQIIKHDFDTEIRGTFNRLEGVIVNFLSSDQIDLPAKLDVLEEQFGEFTDQLELGKGVGEALEIAIDVPGLADQINHFESIVGNLILNLAEFAADVLAALPGQAEAAAAIRRSVEPLALGQLQFDLDVSTSEQDIADAISRAAARGVASEDVTTAIQDTFHNASEGNDFEKMLNLSNVVADLTSSSDMIATIQQQIVTLGAERARTLDQGRLSEINTQLSDLNRQLTTAQANAELKLTIDATNLAEGTEDVVVDVFKGSLRRGEYDVTQSVLDSVDGTALGDGLQVLLAQSFRAALDSGNIVDARAIGELLGNPEALAEVERTATEYAAILTEKLSSGDFTGALNLAQLTGDAKAAELAMSALRSQVNGQGINVLGERAAGPMGAPSERGAEIGSGNWVTGMTGNIDTLTMTATTKGPVIVQQFSDVKGGIEGVGGAAAENFPSVGQDVIDLSALIIANMTPVLALFQQTAEAMALVSAGPGTGGGGAFGAPPSHDSGGWLGRGEATMVNGEMFVSPGDAFALGLANQSIMSRYGLVAGMRGGGDTTNNRTMNINNQYHVQSQAQAVGNANTLANGLRGY